MYQLDSDPNPQHDFQEIRIVQHISIYEDVYSVESTNYRVESTN